MISWRPHHEVHPNYAPSPDFLAFDGGRVVGRVFKHKLADFQLMSRAGKAVASSTRKLVVDVRPGDNAAWSADTFKAEGKLAANTKDVLTTGSVQQKGR